jgi:hypothetical protein
VTITYPLLTIVDDSGAIVVGATVAMTSFTDKAGSAIGSPGATLNRGADPFLSIDYDAEAKNEAIVTLAISKVGSTITGTNAAPRFYLARDSSRVLTALPGGTATLQTVALDGGTVSASPTPTSSDFTATGNLHSPAGGYPVAPMSVLWGVGAANEGVKFPIVGHTVAGGNHNFTVAAMPLAPAPGDTFLIV